MDIETFKLALYVCGCGYKTTNTGSASKHKKVTCGHAMSNEMTEFVLKKDHLASHGKTDSDASLGDVVTRDKITNINNSTHNGDNIDNSTNITNLTLVLPERTTKDDFLEYLRELDHLGYRAPEQIATMPGKMLMFTRDAKKLPGALVERDRKIIEKLPDGTERIMGKKKAIQTYTHEAVDALCLRPPANGVCDFLETERGSRRTKISLQDAAKLRVTNPREYHQGVPEDVKFRHQKIESHTEKYLDKITTENKLNGFL
jgi:hypothetical protein